MTVHSVMTVSGCHSSYAWASHLCQCCQTLFYILHWQTEMLQCLMTKSLHPSEPLRLVRFRPHHFLPKWAWFCLRERLLLFSLEVKMASMLESKGELCDHTIDFVYQTQISILTCIQCFFFFPVYFTFTSPP